MRHLVAAVTLASLTAIAAGASAQIVVEQRLEASAGVAASPQRLLATADRGATWRDITPPAVTGVDGLAFASAADGWALVDQADGAALLARTSDGGARWSLTALPLNAADRARHGGQGWIDRLDGAHAFVMLRLAGQAGFSHGLLLATGNGGTTWRRLPDPPLGEPTRFASPRVGWLAGGPRGDQLFVTRDGGQSWSAVEPPRPSAIGPAASVRYELAGGSGSEVLIVARYAGAGGVTSAILRPRAGGWAAATLLPAWVDGGSAVAARAGIAVRPMHGGALETTSPGSRALAAAPAVARASLEAADFTDPSHGWVLTSRGACARFKASCVIQTRLLATDNGGKAWRDVTPPGLGLRVFAEARSAAPVRLGSVGLGSGEGFDACSPTPSGLAAWYANSPYRYVNVYIGGNNAYCPQPGLTTAWVNTVIGQGWGLIPTWVGPQAPCTSAGGTSHFSSNPTTAGKQGKQQARLAAAKMGGVGLGGTIVYYDLEYYNDNASCAAATKAFLDGWTQGLHAAGYTAAVYGSPTNAAADWLGLSSPPDDVWMALWNGKADVFPLPPLPNSAWANHQRLHQYQGNANQTWGGVHYNIDEDFLDGPVAQ